MCSSAHTNEDWNNQRWQNARFSLSLYLSITIKFLWWRGKRFRIGQIERERKQIYSTYSTFVYYSNFGVSNEISVLFWPAFGLGKKCRYLFQCCTFQHCRMALFLDYSKQHSKWSGFFICWNVILSFSYISYYPLSKQKWQPTLGILMRYLDPICVGKFWNMSANTKLKPPGFLRKRNNERANNLEYSNWEVS